MNNKKRKINQLFNPFFGVRHFQNNILFFLLYNLIFLIIQFNQSIYLFYYSIYQVSIMTFVFSIAWAFSLTYCTYWFLTMINSPDSDLTDQLAEPDSILALSYLCYNFLTTLIIAGYAIFLKIKFNLPKIEIKNVILKNHKNKILGHTIISIIYAIIIFILLMQKQNKFQQQNFFKIHTFILCIVQYIQFYNIAKVYKYLQKVKIEIIYFVILTIFISVVVFLDGYYTNTPGYRHQISGNIILLIELIYLQFFFASEKIILSSLLKIVQYVYIIRYYLLFSKVFDNPSDRNEHSSISFISMLFIFILVCMIAIKDFLFLYIKIKKKYIKYRQNIQKSRVKARIIQHFKRKRNQFVNLSQLQMQQSILQNCTICLDNFNQQNFIRLNCNHFFISNVYLNGFRTDLNVLCVEFKQAYDNT